MERLRINYFHETFRESDRMERLFRELKDRIERFYNNVNSKTLKSVEEVATVIALIHNIVKLEERR